MITSCNNQHYATNPVDILTCIKLTTLLQYACQYMQCLLCVYYALLLWNMQAGPNTYLLHGTNSVKVKGLMLIEHTYTGKMYILNALSRVG